MAAAVPNGSWRRMVGSASDTSSSASSSSSTADRTRIQQQQQQQHNQVERQLYPDDESSSGSEEYTPPSSVASAAELHQAAELQQQPAQPAAAASGNGNSVGSEAGGGSDDDDEDSYGASDFDSDHSSDGDLPTRVAGAPAAVPGINMAAVRPTTPERLRTGTVEHGVTERPSPLTARPYVTTEDHRRFSFGGNHYPAMPEQHDPNRTGAAATSRRPQRVARRGGGGGGGTAGNRDTQRSLRRSGAVTERTRRLRKPQMPATYGGVRRGRRRAANGGGSGVRRPRGSAAAARAAWRRRSSSGRLGAGGGGGGEGGAAVATQHNTVATESSEYLLAAGPGVYEGDEFSAASTATESVAAHGGGPRSIFDRFIAHVAAPPGLPREEPDVLAKIQHAAEHTYVTSMSPPTAALSLRSPLLPGVGMPGLHKLDTGLLERARASAIATAEAAAAEAEGRANQALFGAGQGQDASLEGIPAVRVVGGGGGGGYKSKSGSIPSAATAPHPTLPRGPRYGGTALPHAHTHTRAASLLTLCCVVSATLFSPTDGHALRGPPPLVVVMLAAIPNRAAY